MRTSGPRWRPWSHMPAGAGERPRRGCQPRARSGLPTPKARGKLMPIPELLESVASDRVQSSGLIEPSLKQMQASRGRGWRLTRTDPSARSICELKLGDCFGRGGGPQTRDTLLAHSAPNATHSASPSPRSRRACARRIASPARPMANRLNRPSRPARGALRRHHRRVPGCPPARSISRIVSDISVACVDMRTIAKPSAASALPASSPARSPSAIASVRMRSARGPSPAS